MLGKIQIKNHSSLTLVGSCIKHVIVNMAFISFMQCTWWLCICIAFMHVDQETNKHSLADNQTYDEEIKEFLEDMPEKVATEYPSDTIVDLELPQGNPRCMSYLKFQLNLEIIDVCALCCRSLFKLTCIYIDPKSHTSMIGSGSVLCLGWSIEASDSY